MQTAYAARGVLNRLNANFQQMNYLFADFYDFDRGLEPVLKRKLSQVPIDVRGKDWVSIMWSRDTETLSYVNKPFQLVRETSDPSRVQAVRGKLVFCSVVFTYVSNSMAYLERFAEDFFDYIPDGFCTKFYNTPFPEWNSKKEIQVGARFVARVFNGMQYRCTKAGTTGSTEPTWTSAGAVTDGTVVWTPENPEKLSVLFENVAFSGLQKFGLDTEDTLAKFDIGGRLYFPILRENIDPETGLPRASNPIDPNTGLPIYSSGFYRTNSIVPVIKYPKADIFNELEPGSYLETVTPTPEHWRSK